MRKLATTFFALVLMAGCSGGGSPSFQTDRTALLFGQDYGNATLLGTQPLNTLQLMNSGKGDLKITGISIVAGTAPDGGEAQDTSAFTLSAPSLPDTIPAGGTDFVQVVFNPSATGRFQAILAITSNDSTNPTLNILLSGDCVTPTVAIVQYSQEDGNIAQGTTTSLVATDVQLAPIYPDGGGGYSTGYGNAQVWFADTGTFQLQFQQAHLAGDAGQDSPFYICTNTIQGTANCQNVGPIPDTLSSTYEDGGLALDVFPDGGAQLDLSRLQVVFDPAVPGTYTDHVIIDSSATNTPEIVLTVTGTAHP